MSRIRRFLHLPDTATDEHVLEAVRHELSEEAALPERFGGPDRSDPQLTLLELEARELAVELRHQLPENLGFTLFVFDYGEKGNLTYVSTANRNDMLRTIGVWLMSELEKDIPR